MGDIFKRWRKQRGSGSSRPAPSKLVPIESVGPTRIGTADLAACGAVAIVAFALIALIWIVTMGAVAEQSTEIQDRAEQALVGQAATMAETLAYELLLIDQSLTIIQANWKADSASVDLIKLQEQMPALTAVADDLFIVNEKHIIQQDILPKAVGQGIGSTYVTFPRGSLEQYGSDGTKNKDSLMLQAGIGGGVEARQFPTYILRPLDHPQGWLVGASYRSSELVKLFAGAALGYNSVVALVDTKRGVVQAVVGHAARRPKTDVSKSPLFGMLTRSRKGTWIGDTVIDGTRRLHAFHRVADRDMAVVVAANWSEVMVPADNLAAGARSLAIAATALVLAIGGHVLWELYTIRGHRRQKRILDRSRSELERLRLEESSHTARARVNAARLQAVMDHTADGIALFDSSLRLAQWNHPFLRGIGIEPRREMSLDTLMRDQIGRGLFGTIQDIETEVGRRTGILRAGDPAGLPQPGADGDNLVLRGIPTAEEGFVLMLTGFSWWEAAPVRPSSTEIDALGVFQPASRPVPIEW